MRARRNELHHVLGADDREQERLEIAVDRGDEHRSAGLHQLCERADRGIGVGHVLQHLHARNDIELARVRRYQRFGIGEPVVDRQVLLGGVQLRDFDHAFGEVDSP